MEKRIVESGMDFGSSDDHANYYIEKDPGLASIHSKRVRSVELLKVHRNNLLFIEAKATCPNRFQKGQSEEKQVKFNEYVQEICEKFAHSLATYFAIRLNLKKSDTISENVLTFPLNTEKFVLLLVVKNAQPYWLEGYKDDINKTLLPYLKIWGISHVLVINEETAIRRGIVFSH